MMFDFCQRQEKINRGLAKIIQCKANVKGILLVIYCATNKLLYQHLPLTICVDLLKFKHIRTSYSNGKCIVDKKLTSGKQP